LFGGRLFSSSTILGGLFVLYFEEIDTSITCGRFQNRSSLHLFTVRVVFSGFALI